MAAIAARLIQPGVGILTDLLHAPVTVSALHSVHAGHHISQALGLWSRVAVVAARSAIGADTGVLFVHCIGQAG